MKLSTVNLRRSLHRAITCLGLMIAITGAAFAQETAPQTQVAVSDQSQLVKQQFKPLFDQVTAQLAKDKQHFLDNPIAYHEFISRTLQPLWDVDSTTSALIGRKGFEQLDTLQQSELVQAVSDTLIRYAFEGLEYYSGQQFQVVDAVLNQQSTLGWIQVLMVSPVIPDITLDVLIKQAEPDIWKAVDVRVKGITYVAVKKHTFRETIKEQGVTTLITELQQKNREYFTELCAKTGAAGAAPCAAKAEQ